MKRMRQDAPAQQEGGMRYFVKMVVSIALVFGIFYGTRLIVPFVVGWTGWHDQLVGLAIRSILAVVAFIILGGARWLLPSPRAIGHAWRFAGYTIIYFVIMGGLSFFLNCGSLTTEQIAAITIEKVLHNTLFFVVLCILVGINEEVLFRGLLFGGLLAVIGGKRRGILCAAIISSLVFGFFHVMNNIDYGNLLSIAASLAKTIQTGAVGFILCVPMLEKRNLVGAMTVHSFTDWIVIMGNVFVGLPQDLGIYVTADAQTSMASIALYAVTTLIFLPKVISGVRRLLVLEEPEYGPLVS